MALQIKNDQSIINSDKNIVYQYQPYKTGIPNPPYGLPIGSPSYSYVGAKVIKVPPAPPIEMPEANLPRAMNYLADYGGCGWWRLIWPEMVINGYNKAIVTSLTQMILDQNFYNTIKAIKFQRQATDSQKMFISALMDTRKKTGIRLIYEIDDIVFREDIPDYNRCKEAFLDEKIINNILEIMKNMDEITVTCPFMKNYYQNKTGNKNVTVIPNYIPKFWADRFYKPEKLKLSFDKNKKRPRILYAGSGTHIDVLNKTNGNDDFAHVIKEIVKARKDFHFIFKGCFPLQLKPFIDSGEMSYYEWSPLFDLPEDVEKLECQAVFAPLTNNIFNKSKSNIKMLESGCIGLPGAFQNLCTYDKAEFKFDNGSDLIDQLKQITSDENVYMKASTNARKYTETMWLEDHIDEHIASYFTAFGSKERNLSSPKLIEINPDQKTP
jgi:glycosyltransferase involved in cell wall biosynthesis